MATTQKKVCAHTYRDGVKITASGANESEALKNLQAKIRQMDAQAKGGRA